MHDLSLLRDLVILVAVAIPVVGVAQYFKVPTVVGFLLTGIAVGPHAIGLIPEVTAVDGLADLGVVLLLFAIGLELSLSRIIKIGRLVVQAGSLQVFMTVAIVALLSVWLGGGLNEALLLGALVALSSTAIVLKLYADRGELDTPHGRVALAILLFQDLAVVLLIVLVPLLGGSTAGEGVVRTLTSVFGSVVSLVAVVAAGRWIVPAVLERIVGLRNRELFTLCIGLFGLSAAYIASLLGLSLEIGAFMAGLVISESEYGLHALSDVLPFRDTFSGIFFMSVGMLLDVNFVAVNAPVVLGGAVAIAVIKVVVTTGVVRTTRRSLEVSLLTGLGLAQVGEFSFVLANAAAPYGILDERTNQLFLGASVLSMLAAPLLISVSRPVAAGVSRFLGRSALEVLPHEKKRVSGLTGHAIIVGWGLAGRSLSRVLKAAGFPYIILEQNGQAVRAGRRSGEPMFFGDGTQREVLERVGITRARVIVYSISSPGDERRGVSVARYLNPALHVIVRTRFVTAIDDLEQLGATDVVVEEFEAALELFAKVLEHYEVPSETIHAEVEAVRSEHYGLLRGEAQPDIRIDPFRYLKLHDAVKIVDVAEGSAAVGENPTSLRLRARTGAVVVAAVRNGRPYYTPDPEFVFAPRDAVVLVGEPDALTRAVEIFGATKHTNKI